MKKNERKEREQNEKGNEREDIKKIGNEDNRRWKEEMLTNQMKIIEALKSLKMPPPRIKKQKKESEERTEKVGSKRLIPMDAWKETEKKKRAAETTFRATELERQWNWQGWKPE